MFHHNGNRLFVPIAQRALSSLFNYSAQQRSKQCLVQNLTNVTANADIYQLPYRGDVLIVQMSCHIQHLFINNFNFFMVHFNHAIFLKIA